MFLGFSSANDHRFESCFAFLMLAYVFITITAVAFINMSVRNAAALTGSIAVIFILLVLWIISARDKYIAKQKAGKDGTQI